MMVLLRIDKVKNKITVKRDRKNGTIGAFFPRMSDRIEKNAIIPIIIMENG